MKNKKQELKDNAISLFSEKGYHLTSVQEIAKKCSISKGAFYKHFDSKESLLIDILKNNHEKLFQEARSASFSSSLTKKEILVNKIAVELELMSKNRSFILVLFKEFPPNENMAISSVIKDFRNNLIEWHKSCLIEAFGERINPFVWDLTIMFEGMIKEYSGLIFFHNIQIPASQLAPLIVSSIEAIADSSDNLQPILSKKILDRTMIQEDSWLVKKELDIQLLKVEKGIESLPVLDDEKEKLFSTLSLLREEMNKIEKQAYLIEALTMYLKKNHELVGCVQQVERLFYKLNEKHEGEGL